MQRLVSIFLNVLVLISVYSSMTYAEPSMDVMSMDIEELMQVKITTVSRKEESAFTAPAAVFIITSEDIRRSSATSIPELLRMVPGLHVARSSSNQWAITSRGFNSRYSNKLLVLIDGRTVYNPGFAGVFWDVQDTLIEDIERIEVIRGPGATLWGLNAVNGIINVITKHAKDSNGGLVVGGGGNEERGFGSVRYGAELSEETDFRVFSKYHKRDDLELSNGDDTGDDWDTARSGFRLDHENPNDHVTVSGEIYHNNGDGNGSLPSPLLSPQGVGVDSEIQDLDAGGGHLLGRWSHTLSPTSKTTTQFYYDREKRDDSGGARQRRDTFDIDFQHHSQLLTNLDLIWGAGYRHIIDELDGTLTPLATFFPQTERLDIANGFLQSELKLFDESVKLITGTKFSHNDFSGFEVQPGARLAWEVSERHYLWSAVTRALRLPARFEEDGQVVINSTPLPNGQVGYLQLQPSSLEDTEELLAYEIGYRFMASENLSFDFATFYNEYDNVLAAAASGPPSIGLVGGFPGFVQPVVASFDSSASSYGAEFTSNWSLARWWRLQGSYSYIYIDYDIQQSSFFGGPPMPGAGTFEDTPSHQAVFRSLISLPWDLELDTMYRFVDSLRGLSLSNAVVSSYSQLDVRLAWQPVKTLELAVIGQNLLDAQHQEFVERTANNQRGVYGRATLRF